MVFVEDPWSRIVAVHWADDGPPVGGDGGDACGNGWLPFAGWFQGGDGFPAQVTDPPANIEYSSGARWNPLVAKPPESDPYLFFIPGSRATSARIRVVWQGVLSSGGPPLVAGLWLFPGRLPYPPYNDSSGNPPPNPPPFDPDLSAEVVGSGVLNYAMTPPTSMTIVASFAATSGAMREPRQHVRSPFLPSVRVDPSHYGWPDALKPSEGIWIEVEHDCSGG